MKFVVFAEDGNITIEAPEDITLKQLLAQLDRVERGGEPYGICSLEKIDLNRWMVDELPELIVGYDSIRVSESAFWPLYVKGQDEK